MASITISRNPATGELELSDGGHTEAHRNENIIWKPGSGVKFISNIYPKTPMPTPFFSKVPHRAGSSANWQAQIHNNAVDYSVYNYSISWIPEGSDEIKEYDPTISIKPSDFFFQELAILFVTALVALLGIFLFWRWKNKSK